VLPRAVINRAATAAIPAIRLNEGRGLILTVLGPPILCRVSIGNAVAYPSLVTDPYVIGSYLSATALSSPAGVIVWPSEGRSTCPEAPGPRCPGEGEVTDLCDENESLQRPIGATAVCQSEKSSLWPRRAAVNPPHLDEPARRSPCCEPRGALWGDYQHHSRHKQTNVPIHLEPQFAI